MKQKVVSQKKTYTCIKSGKKSVWNKGVVVVTPTPAPNTWESGYSEIFSSLNLSKDENVELVAIYSDTVIREKATSVLSNFSESISLYKEFLGPIEPFYIVFMSEKDQNFYKDQVTKLEGPSGDSNFFQSNHCLVSKHNYCAYGSNKVSGKIIFYQVIGSEYSPDNTWIKISNYHEAVHVYQQSLTEKNMYTFFPPWFIEGQATFLGNVSVLNFSTFKQIQVLRESQINGIITTLPEITKMTTDDLALLFGRLESDIEYVTGNSLGYNLGMLMSEYLYLKFAAESVNELILSVYRSRNFSLGLRETLKIEKQDLYQQMAKYVLDQIYSK